MDIQEIRETPVWLLYQKGQNFHRMRGIYTDTDRNYRFYNDDQWNGAKLGGVEPVQKNFLKPIVKYKCAVIHSNLYGIVYSSMNFENREFRKTAEQYCELLNAYVARLWEQDKMDIKLRRITKDAAINGEGIIFVHWGTEQNRPVHEIVKKNDVYYGNENDEDIQAQPYILIRKRMTRMGAIDLALREGMKPNQKTLIIGDNETFEESGDAAKVEVDDGVTVVYKLYKEDGIVKYDVATRWVSIAQKVRTGLRMYPVAHFNWEEKEGSARGEGEIRNLIPNQIEVNKTEMRRVLTVKSQAYPHKVVDVEKVENVSALNTVGGVIKTKGKTVDDVRKVVGVIQPAQMSPDVKQLSDDLIQMSRDLAGAGDVATGQVDPESASGRAILAVQNASRAPMTEQTEGCKNFVEDIAKIDLEMLITYSEKGINMEQEVTDPQSGQTYYQVVNIPQVALRNLQATVKIDITPKSVYDKFAQEQTLENLLMNGLLTAQRAPELKVYAQLLDDDSVAPKQKILEAVAKIEEEQQKIARINAKAQMMQQRAQQYLMEGPDAQAQQMAEANQKARMMNILRQKAQA